MSEQARLHARRALVFGAASVVVAGSTAWLIFQLMQGYQTELGELRAPGSATAQVVAIEDLPAGMPITETQLTIEELRQEWVDTELVYGDIAAVVGDVPRTRILAGEVVRAERLLGSGEGAGLDAVVADGMRAVSIKADLAEAISGLLRPAHQVDVIVTIRPEGDAIEAKWVTHTVLQDVRVLAVGQSLLGNEREDGDKPQAMRGKNTLVTLEVTPVEAEKIAMAAVRGQLHLTLRGASDRELVEENEPLVANTLVGLPQKPDPVRRRTTRRATPKPVQSDKAEVIQGTTTSVEQFDASGRKVTDTKRR